MDDLIRARDAIDAELEVAHHFVENTEGQTEVYLKRMLLKPGQVIGKHVHSTPHVSILARGKVSVQVDLDEPQIFEAPAHLLIAAHRMHTILALTGSVWYCTWGIGPDMTVETIDHHLINER